MKDVGGDKAWRQVSFRPLSPPSRSVSEREFFRQYDLGPERKRHRPKGSKKKIKHRRLQYRKTVA